MNAILLYRFVVWSETIASTVFEKKGGSQTPAS